MAQPKWHAVPTIIIAVISIIFYTPLALLSKNVFIFLLVFGFGFFLDIDHRPFRRTPEGRLRIIGTPIEGKTNFMHGWGGLCIAVVLSIVVVNCLPFISYSFHILLDGANRANLKYPWWSPLPTLIHRFYPRRLTYYY